MIKTSLGKGGMISTMYLNHHFGANHYIIFSRYSPEDSIGTPVKDTPVKAGCMTIMVLCAPISSIGSQPIVAHRPNLMPTTLNYIKYLTAMY